MPSNWETQDFGAYTYGFQETDHQETDHQEKGLYRYTFTAPEEWKDKHLAIVFEGAMMDTEVKINGSGNDRNSPTFPKVNIDFLYAFSPIGTKFQAAESLGLRAKRI